ncbi:MAG: tetratricopeptide repeat protein [bacterium]
MEKIQVQRLKESWADLYEHGSMLLALEELDSILNAYPRDVEAIFYRACTLYRLRRYDEARRVFEQALKEIEKLSQELGSSPILTKLKAEAAKCLEELKKQSPSILLSDPRTLFRNLKSGILPQAEEPKIAPKAPPVSPPPTVGREIAKQVLPPLVAALGRTIFRKALERSGKPGTRERVPETPVLQRAPLQEPKAPVAPAPTEIAESLPEQFEEALQLVKQCWNCGTTMAKSEDLCPECLNSQSATAATQTRVQDARSSVPTIDESRLDSAFGEADLARTQRRPKAGGPKAVPPPLRPLTKDDREARAERARTTLLRDEGPRARDTAISFRAWGALLLSIFAFVLPFQWAFSVIALYNAGKALNEIDRSDGKTEGKGAARAAIILGIIGLVSGLIVKHMR